MVQQKSYIKNYLQTYLWHGAAIMLNLASMFIVIPFITDNKIIYGVYSVCISTAMFLNYADLGFVSAGIKYAGESFAKGNHEEEVKLFGFSGFILFIFVSLIAGVYFLFSYNPSLLIKDISNSNYLSIASSLLFIQAIFSYNTVLQRFVTGVFQVRIEQYIYQRINIAGSIIRLSSVFYFFESERYDIVGYFLFGNLIAVASLLIGVAIIRKRYHISILKYLKAFRFSWGIYKKTKSLAFSSFFVTIIWVLYYELDIIVIGKLLGSSAVAIFALAFTIMKFLRSLSGVIFSPFQNRFNHFVGLENFDGLKTFLMKVIHFSMPIYVIGMTNIIILNKNIVLTWAGSEYMHSALILFLLATNFIFAFITIPGANMFVALVRVKELYWVNILTLIVFWAGVLLTINLWGVTSFAIFKLVSGTLAMLFYLRFLLGILNTNLMDFMKQTLWQIIIPLIIHISFLLLVLPYLPDVKGKFNLIIVIGTGGLGFLVGIISLYFTSDNYKHEFHHNVLKHLNIKH